MTLPRYSGLESLPDLSLNPPRTPANGATAGKERRGSMKQDEWALLGAEIRRLRDAIACAACNQATAVLGAVNDFQYAHPVAFARIVQGMVLAGVALICAAPLVCAWMLYAATE